MQFFGNKIDIQWISAFFCFIQLTFSSIFKKVDILSIFDQEKGKILKIYLELSNVPNKESQNMFKHDM